MSLAILELILGRFRPRSRLALGCLGTQRCCATAEGADDMEPQESIESSI